MRQKTIDKINALINDADYFALKIRDSEKSVKARKDLRAGEYSAYTGSVMSFFKSVLDCESPYIKEYQNCAQQYNLTSVLNGIDILKRILGDVKEGWLSNLKGLVSAEIFSNFLDMADHLILEGYKDPAAIIIGSVLEEHLRNLCIKNSIAITTTDSSGKIKAKRASAMNDDVAKKGIYNLLEQKSVTTWLDLRNKAAHGKYSEYDLKQVINMHQVVKDFIIRNPI